MVVALLFTLVFSWFNLRVKIRNNLPFKNYAWIGYGAELSIISILCLLKQDRFLSGGFVVALLMLLLADLIDDKRADLIPVINANITAVLIIIIFMMI